MSDSVTAEIVLRKRDGSSILDAVAGITAETIERYAVEPDVVAEAAALLEAEGFRVEQTSPYGLTVAGPKARFEEVFGTELELGPDSADAGVRASRPFRIPERLSAVVAEVTLPVPPERFP